MWPDLAKFDSHFDIIRKACGICLTAYLALGNFEPTLTIFCNWAKFRCCKWPKIEENIGIWSHWCRFPLTGSYVDFLFGLNSSLIFLTKYLRQTA